jgi:hypothetical protein
MRTILAAAAMIFLASCGSGSGIPSKEESRRTIAQLKQELDTLDANFLPVAAALPKGSDLISHTRSSAINILLARVASRTPADIQINFLATRPLWKEDRSVLGIGYTNFVDIDTGSLTIDLKTFTFNNFSNNIVDASIEIEGTGSIKASGKYIGVAAGVSPQIHFYLNEQIQFVVTAADSDYIRLNPVPKTVLLKTKVTITMLGLNLPYYTEIPLQTVELIKPVMIPSAVRSEIVFPIPAAQYGSERLNFVKRYLRFTRSAVRANNNILEYRSNIDFEKE